MQVLLIEDQNLSKERSLVTSLEIQGHLVTLAHSPDVAAQQTLTLWPSLIVFNPAQTVLNIASFKEALAETSLDVPYLVVEEKHHMEPELKKSIENAIADQKDRFFRLPDLIIDFQQRNVLQNGRPYSLTPKEFKLLKLLVDNKNEILSRKTIMLEVWETDYMGDTRTLDVHIRWLREKIEDNPSRPRRLVTIRGVGYRFLIEDEE